MRRQDCHIFMDSLPPSMPVRGSGMDTLRGHVAVVTGAASGIGLALAERFASEGMNVVMADIEPGALKEAEVAVSDRGAATLSVLTDVTDLGAVHALAAAAKERFGT